MQITNNLSRLYHKFIFKFQNTIMISKRFGIFLVIIASIGLSYTIITKNDSITANNKSVMILQIIEHPALDSTRAGIEQYLDTCCKINTVYESAQGDPALASQIAQKFAQQKPASVITIGTVATQSAIQKMKDIPIVFSSVTDPVGSGILKNLNAPEGNVTGVSNYISTGKQLDVFIKFMPNIKNIGFIYNPGESNSIKLLEDTKIEAAKRNINIVEALANSSSEISTATNSIINKVDAIFINNDSTALSAIQVIVHIAEDNKIPVLCSDIDTVDDGVMIAVGPDQLNIGTETGKVVENIINNRIPVSKIPVSYPSSIFTRVNIKAATKIGLFISDELLKDSDIEVVG